MINIVCVLKKPETGRLKYDASWVQKLQQSVARNLPRQHRFVCLTDIGEIPWVDTVPLEHNWMMYWSKVEIFRPGLFEGTTLYFDIDSMVVGSLEPFLGEFQGMTMLTDFYPFFKNSGFMRWNASDPVYNELYYLMKKDPIGQMVKHRYKGAVSYGDQEFIEQNLTTLGVPTFEWQKLFPKHWFLEFSFEGRLNPVVQNPPVDTKICYSLGHPKFDEVSNVELVKNHWK